MVMAPSYPSTHHSSASIFATSVPRLKNTSEVLSGYLDDLTSVTPFACLRGIQRLCTNLANMQLNVSAGRIPIKPLSWWLPAATMNRFVMQSKVHHRYSRHIEMTLQMLTIAPIARRQLPGAEVGVGVAITYQIIVSPRYPLIYSQIAIAAHR